MACVCVYICWYYSLTASNRVRKKLFVLVEVSRYLCSLNGHVSLSHDKIYLAYQITNIEQI
jgi:hypothetical protein